MDQWETALLIGALITAAVSFRDRRALVWIAIGAANFAATTTWARYVSPPPPTAFVTAVFDAGTALLIITYGRAKWEKALSYVFQFMIYVSIGRMIGLLNDRYLYVLVLELANWAVLLLIGGTHIMSFVDEWMARLGLGGAAHGALHRYRVVAFSRRKTYPFWSPFHTG